MKQKKECALFTFKIKSLRFEVLDTKVWMSRRIQKKITKS